jgi:hypothetical protein
LVRDGSVRLTVDGESEDVVAAVVTGDIQGAMGTRNPSWFDLREK